MIDTIVVGGVETLVAYPEEGRGPAVILCPDASGIDEYMREMLGLYAEEGYVVLASALQNALTRENLNGIENLNAIIEHARALPQTTGKVGIVGFGAGAQLAYDAACRLNIDVAVAYGHEALDITAKPSGPITLQWVDGPQAEKIQQKFAGDLNAQVFTYSGVGAGFERRDAPNYSRALSLLAHDRAIGALRRVIGPNYDLGALWEHHKNCEFVYKDAERTMASMVSSPYVNHIPTMTGGVGFEQLARFYKYHFIPKNSSERSGVLISRTIGATQVVEEILSRFVHDTEIDWLLPGVKPTGKRVEIPLVVIVKFRGPKIYHEHIYWDQASVLAQLGLIDPSGLPVAGVEEARKLIDDTLPSNTLLPNWADSAGLPVP